MTRAQFQCLLLAVVLGACGTDESDTDGASTDENGAQLSGTYAVHDRVTTITTLPGVGEYTMTGHYYGLAEITADGSDHQIRQWYCAGRVEWDGPLEILFSDDSVRAIPEIVGPLVVDADADGVRISRATLSVPVGFDGEADATLPIDATDPRIFDADGDGHPGITVQMEGSVTGAIYVARIERSEWDAVADADGQFHGQIRDASEQFIIAATSPLLAAQPIDRPHPDPAESTIHMVPVAETTDCAQLLDMMPSLGF